MHESGSEWAPDARVRPTDQDCYLALPHQPGPAVGGADAGDVRRTGPDIDGENAVVSRTERAENVVRPTRLTVRRSPHALTPGYCASGAFATSYETVRVACDVGSAARWRRAARPRARTCPRTGRGQAGTADPELVVLHAVRERLRLPTAMPVDGSASAATSGTTRCVVLMADTTPFWCADCGRPSTCRHPLRTGMRGQSTDRSSGPACCGQLPSPPRRGACCSRLTPIEVPPTAVTQGWMPRSPATAYPGDAVGLVTRITEDRRR